MRIDWSPAGWRVYEGDNFDNPTTRRDLPPMRVRFIHTPERGWLEMEDESMTNEGSGEADRDEVDKASLPSTPEQPATEAPIADDVEATGTPEAETIEEPAAEAE